MMSAVRGIGGPTVGLVVALFIAIMSPAAQAAPLSVNCDTGGNLQAKIDAAASGSTILVKGTCFGNFEIAGKGLTLKGNPTATLDGNDLERTLDITAVGKAVHLVGLTITGGASGQGAGIGSTAGNLTLTNVTVTGNLAAQTSGNPQGGGIYSNGNITLTGSTVSANRVLATDTAFDPFGGGLYVPSGNLTIKNSVISGNRATVIDTSGFNAAEGGGFYLGGGKLTVQGSSISGNRVTASAADSAEAEGAGGFQTVVSTASISASKIIGNVATAVSLSSQAFVHGAGLSVDVLALSRSTVDGNKAIATVVQSSGTNAIADGVGIYAETSVKMMASTVSRNSATATTPATNWQASAYGGGVFSPIFNATNSTIGLNALAATAPSGSTANAYGGGIYADSSPSSLTDSTVAGNTLAAGGGGTFYRTGGGVFGSSGMTVKATIMANNTGIFGADCFGTPASGGYNLIGNGAQCDITKKLTDMVNDPKLGTLGNHGGPTQTMPIALSSPARDAIPKAACAVPRDQRGVHRPQGPRCDIGAYERKVA